MFEVEVGEEFGGREFLPFEKVRLFLYDGKGYCCCSGLSLVVGDGY
jgi:hypothetical protein